MFEDEARENLPGKVRGVQYNTKKMGEKSYLMQSELKTLHKIQTELRSELRMKSSHGARNAYERLFRKDHEVRQYLEEAPEMKSKLEEERSQCHRASKHFAMILVKGKI